MKKQRRGEESHCISTNPFKILNDLSINSDDEESISVEILFEKRRIQFLMSRIDNPKVKLNHLRNF